jgi:outer membrane protein TolC
MRSSSEERMTDRNDGRETLALNCRISIDVGRPHPEKIIRSGAAPLRLGTKRTRDDATTFSAIWIVLVLLVAGCLNATQNCMAAEKSDDEMTLLRGPAKSAYKLPEVIELTARNYPQIRVAFERALAAKGETSLAKTAYLPKIDTIMQFTRATENNIPGVLFPQTTIPFLTHPEAGGTRFKGFWGDNIGTLLSLEVWDFGLRRSNVRLAQTGASQAGAKTELTKFDACLASADAFLVATSADETVHVFESNLLQREAFAHQVHTLVDTGLRPGVDAARADAEVAKAQNQLYESQRSAEVDLVNVSETMGNPTMQVRISTQGLVNSMPPPAVFQMPDFEKHPLVLFNQAEINNVTSRVHVLEHTWYPHLWFEGALYGRGTSTPGFGQQVAGGILPQVANYAVGFRLSFPLMQIYEIRARKRIEMHNLQAERANYDQSILELRAKEANARILLEKARQIAQNTPKFVEAARQTEMQARERYKVGLNTVVDVAEAQRLLVEAEVDNAVAQVNVWRAELAMAGASGDLRPFVQLVTRAEVINKP